MFPYPSGAEKLARRASRRLHRHGHPRPLQTRARFQRAASDGLGRVRPARRAIRRQDRPASAPDDRWKNIATFKRPDLAIPLGFSYDWSRELATTDPDYFQWTQWIFLKLYNSWFNPKTKKAEPIETLEYPVGLRLPFSTSNKAELENLELSRRTFRDSKRLAFVKEAPVWWCEQLGTVLANEEVVDGKSEVGGFPVARKLMRQWMLRITVYAEKLLTDLDTIDWSDSLKEMQRNWIGKSEGAYVCFSLEGRAKLVKGSPKNVTESDPDVINFEEIEAFIRSSNERKTDSIWVFTTRPDTLFGATYMVLAPEHPCVDELTTDGQRATVQAYKVEVQKNLTFNELTLPKKRPAFSLALTR